jgi:oxaloacetate decarboxylase alpha subunit
MRQPLSPELVEVKAQISGIFYRGPAPDAPPFVEVDSIVEKGQTLALLEAMKLFTKVKAPMAGKIAEIRRGNAETVSAGQVLFALAPL